MKTITINVAKIGGGIAQVQARKVDIVPWLDTFIHREGDTKQWTITEKRSGHSLAYPKWTQREAIAEVKHRLEDVGEKKTLAAVHEKPVLNA